MSSILGQKLGNYYDESAAKAAEAIAAVTEKVYLHCYLGMHRIQVVRENLTKLGIAAGMYTVSKGERQESRVLLDTAAAAFAAGRYPEAMDALAKIGPRDMTPDALLLRAWCHFRMNQVTEAKSIFTTILADSTDNPSANTGLGYCFLREGDFVRAEQCFAKAVAKEPKNADALGGLGLALYRAGRLEDAGRNLEASIKIAPNAELQAILDQIRNRQ
jgi:Flp pilus assembly protein TadD